MAGDRFKLFLQMKGSFKKQTEMSVEELLKSAHDAIEGLTEKGESLVPLLRSHNAILREQKFDTIELLKYALENAKRYNMYDIGIPVLIIDMMISLLEIQVSPKFKHLSKDQGERLEGYWEYLKPNLITSVKHLQIITEKGWNKLKIPIGIKIQLESILVPDLSEQFENLNFETPYLLTGGRRMKVRSVDGRCFEVDRFCPHKEADMLGAQVIGSRLICPKHGWEFDLGQGGSCVKGKKKCTINAILIDW